MAPFGGLFRRAVLLPFVPIGGGGKAGTLIVLGYDQDPCEVETVCINSAGAVIVWVPGVTEGSYRQICDDGEMKGQFEYETEEWDPCDGRGVDVWEPPVDAKPYRATGWPDESKEQQ